MFLKKTFFHLKKFDWITFIIVIFFISLGIMAIYGISLSSGEVVLSNFKKQIIFACAGLAIIFLITILDYKLLKNYSYFIYGIAVILLIAVLMVGKVIRGTKGWFTIYGFGFQPVEFAKIALILILAKFFSKKTYESKQFKTILKSGLITLLVILPTMLQPDMGSVFILFMIWFGMILMFGIKKRHFFMIGIMIIIVAICSWIFLLKNYQKDRIYTFLSPENDPLGKGYNITQSIIAIGSGKLLGKGLAFGSQSQLKFLPETKTDFIFSVISEELGFIIAMLIFLGWAILFYRLCSLAKKTKNNFAYFLVIGFSIFLFLHLFVNIGVSIGILPVTGIPLPFMSYGGSFLLTCLLSIGIIESIAVRT
ncbi:rod shape-determining protein RodA [Patescibacteria group bacterium]